MLDSALNNRTRVASANTDGILMSIVAGDDDRVSGIVADWETAMGFQMERVEVLAHRQLNVNAYIEIYREDGGAPAIKSKGSMAHDPGIHADHNSVVVNQAIAFWMLDGRDPEQYIRDAAQRRDILLFSEMRSAPSSQLRYGGKPIGRICRVYRSSWDPDDLPALTKDATGSAGEQRLEPGYAYLPGIDWPDTDDVDVDYYLLKMRLLIAQTDQPYAPHHNRIAAQLSGLGLTVGGVGGAATDIEPLMSARGDAQLDAAGRPVMAINPNRVAFGTRLNPRNYSGDRGLAVKVQKSAGIMMLPPGVASRDSLVLPYGTKDGEIKGEIHDRVRLEHQGLTVKALKKAGVGFIDKGSVIVFDSAMDLVPIELGAVVTVKEEHRVDQSETTTSDDLPASEPLTVAEYAAAEEVFISNDEFIEAVHREHADLAFVCSNDIPPDHPDEEAKRGMWQGGQRINNKGKYLDPLRQNYSCISTFNLNPEGVYRRRAEFFRSLDVVILDDISLDGIAGKVKVNPRSLGFPAPSFIIETSPGNAQWGYILAEPLTHYAEAVFLTRDVLSTRVQGHLLTDQGAKAINRIHKLPVGRNLKLALGAQWQNRLLLWNPDARFAAEDIAGWFGRSLAEVRNKEARVTSAADPDLAAAHPIVAVLDEAGLLRSSAPKSSGWWDLLCPWSDEHSAGSGAETGSAIKIRSDGTWSYSCQHGHCAERGARDLYGWLIEEGYEVTPPGVTLYDNVRRIDRARIVFRDVGGDDGYDDPDPEEGLGDHHQENTGEINAASSPLEEGSLAGRTAHSRETIRKKARAKAEAASANNKRPTLYLEPGSIHVVVRDVAKVMQENLYSRASSLVRIGHAAELDNTDEIRRDDEQPVVIQVNRYWLLRELTERAIFMRFSAAAKKYVRVDCPKDVADVVIHGSEDGAYRPLTALTQTPFLRDDGSVCTDYGYDAASRLLYVPGICVPEIPNHPTKDDAQKAIARLEMLVTQFPFVSAAARSVFIADILTAVARPTLPKSPIVSYTATMPGTGKTLLSSLPNLIAYGHETVQSWPGANEEELKKVLIAILEAGDPVVVFDNIPNGAVVRNAELAAFVTAPEYAGRRLGKTERVRFKNRTRVVLTGNNITCGSDIARRTLVCDLELDLESPRDRDVEWEIPNLPKYIQEHRGELIAAALTVLRAYIVAEDKISRRPLESYEDWSRVVRNPIVWLGRQDPIGNVLFEEDGRGDLATVFEELFNGMIKHRELQTRGMRAGDVVTMATANHNLAEALVMSGCSDAKEVRAVGYWLRANKGRRAGGYKLVSATNDKHTKRPMWKIDKR